MLSFVDIREKCRHAIEITSGIRIEFMIVALCATNGCTHPDVGDVADSVCRVDCQVFLLLNATLMGGLKEPVVTGGDLL